jgi:hypothetical protein
MQYRKNGPQNGDKPRETDDRIGICLDVTKKTKIIKGLKLSPYQLNIITIDS